MNINYRRDVWKMYDFFFLLRRLENENIEEAFINQLGFKPEKKVIKFIEKMRKILDFEDETVEFFLHRDTNRVFMCIPFFKMKKLNNLDEALNLFKTMSEDEMRFNTFNDYFLNNPESGGEFNDEYIKECLKNSEERIKFIRSLDISDESKWRLYEFIQSPRKKIDKFLDSIEKFIQVYKREIVKFEELMEKLEDHIQERVDKEGENIFRDILDDLMPSDYYENIEIRTSFVGFDGLRIDSMKEHGVISVGFKYREVMELMRGKSEEEETIKVISTVTDSIKFRILNCMKEKEVFGKEICSATGLSKAALSYHINELFSMGIIGMRRDGKKVYYSIKKDKIENAIDSLRGYIL